MGRLKSTADLPELTEEKIQEYLHLRHPLLSSPKYKAFNMYLYGWKNDFLAFSKAGYVWETEIKMSRGDFLTDRKNKSEKHRLLREAMKGGSTVPVPNHFVYVCPEGVIRPEDIEGLPYAGLLWVSKGGSIVWFRALGARRLDFHYAQPPLASGKRPVDWLDMYTVDKEPVSSQVLAEFLTEFYDVLGVNVAEADREAYFEARLKMNNELRRDCIVPETDF